LPIQLSPEQERVVGRAINYGLIRMPEDVVEIDIETIRQRLEERLPPTSVKNDDKSVADWSRQLHAWIHSHSTEAPPLPDDALGRESIYQGRGL
jgi:hypothetical protein